MTAKVIGEVKFYPYALRRTKKIYVLKPAIRGDVEILNLPKGTKAVKQPEKAKVAKVSAKKQPKQKSSNLPLLLAFVVLSATIYTSLKS